MSGIVAGAIGALLGAMAVTVPLLTWWVARGSRELGSDAEYATYHTLRTVGKAAAGLHGADPDPARAAHHLRALLRVDALALIGPDDELVLDGAGVEERAAARIGASVRASGRREVFTRIGADDAATDAVAAPIVVDGAVRGALIAFASPVRAPLVRAVGEVARWCGTQLEFSRLELGRTALAQAELRTLRAQISPHFIYNALTAIASFITTDPARARELVLEFADFTRYSFRRHGDFTTLAEELRSIHSYLQLEQARFGDRLRVRLRISPETLATVIPYLCVQPLVENAVRHGLEPREAGGTLTIGSLDMGTRTEITIEDDGIGMDPEHARRLLAQDTDVEHVGLRNVDARLRQMYGGVCGLIVETAPGAGTMVRLRVPKSQPDHEAV